MPIFSLFPVGIPQNGAEIGRNFAIFAAEFKQIREE
jgi:hypothetical protein